MHIRSPVGRSLNDLAGNQPHGELKRRVSSPGSRGLHERLGKARR